MQASRRATALHQLRDPGLNSFVSQDFYGEVLIKEFGRPEDIDALSEKAIIACLELGAKTAFNDPHLYPIRGQRNTLARQKDLKYSVGLSGASATPRRDGVAAGNSALYGIWETRPDMKLAKEIIDNAAEGFAKLQKFV